MKRDEYLIKRKTINHNIIKNCWSENSKTKNLKREITEKCPFDCVYRHDTICKVYKYPATVWEKFETIKFGCPMYLLSKKNIDIQEKYLKMKGIK